MRYRGTSRYAYGYALLRLTELSRAQRGRDDPKHFEFGPLRLDSLEVQGLTVSGGDLSEVTDTLSKAPGLVEMPD